MKNIILLLLICFTTLGITPEVIDNNLYSAQLPEIVVVGNILEGYVPKKASTTEEIITLNKAMFNYVAKYSYLTPAQVYGKFRQEQGRGSELFYKHNNPFNIKGDRASGTKIYDSPEVINGKEIIITSKFARYNNIKNGLDDFIDFIQNERFNHEPSDDKTIFKHFYDNNYHTDPKWWLRVEHAKHYKKYIEV